MPFIPVDQNSVKKMDSVIASGPRARAGAAGAHVQRGQEPLERDAAAHRAQRPGPRAHHAAGEVPARARLRQAAPRRRGPPRARRARPAPRRPPPPPPPPWRRASRRGLRAGAAMLGPCARLIAHKLDGRRAGASACARTAVLACLRGWERAVGFGRVWPPAGRSLTPGRQRAGDKPWTKPQATTRARGPRPPLAMPARASALPPGAVFGLPTPGLMVGSPALGLPPVPAPPAPPIYGVVVGLAMPGTGAGAQRSYELRIDIAAARAAAAAVASGPGPRAGGGAGRDGAPSAAAAAEGGSDGGGDRADDGETDGAATGGEVRPGAWHARVPSIRWPLQLVPRCSVPQRAARQALCLQCSLACSSGGAAADRALARGRRRSCLAALAAATRTRAPGHAPRRSAAAAAARGAGPAPGGAARRAAPGQRAARPRRCAARRPCRPGARVCMFGPAFPGQRGRARAARWPAPAECAGRACCSVSGHRSSEMFDSLIHAAALLHLPGQGRGRVLSLTLRRCTTRWCATAWCATAWPTARTATPARRATRGARSSPGSPAVAAAAAAAAARAPAAVAARAARAPAADRARPTATTAPTLQVRAVPNAAAVLNGGRAGCSGRSAARPAQTLTVSQALRLWCQLVQQRRVLPWATSRSVRTQ